MRNKKTITEAPEIGKRLSENPEYWSSSRYYRGRIAGFFLFFVLQRNIITAMPITAPINMSQTNLEKKFYLTLPLANLVL